MNIVVNAQEEIICYLQATVQRHLHVDVDTEIWSGAQHNCRFSWRVYSNMTTRIVIFQTCCPPPPQEGTTTLQGFGTKAYHAQNIWLGIICIFFNEIRYSEN